MARRSLGVGGCHGAAGGHFALGGEGRQLVQAQQGHGVAGLGGVAAARVACDVAAPCLHGARAQGRGIVVLVGGSVVGVRGFERQGYLAARPAQQAVGVFVGPAAVGLHALQLVEPCGGLGAVGAVGVARQVELQALGGVVAAHALPHLFGLDEQHGGAGLLFKRLGGRRGQVLLVGLHGALGARAVPAGKVGNAFAGGGDVLVGGVVLDKLLQGFERARGAGPLEDALLVAAPGLEGLFAAAFQVEGLGVRGVDGQCGAGLDEGFFVAPAVVEVVALSEQGHDVVVDAGRLCGGRFGPGVGRGRGG